MTQRRPSQNRANAGLNDKIPSGFPELQSRCKPAAFFRREAVECRAGRKGGFRKQVRFGDIWCELLRFGDTTPKRAFQCPGYTCHTPLKSRHTRHNVVNQALKPSQIPSQTLTQSRHKTAPSADVLKPTPRKAIRPVRGRSFPLLPASRVNRCRTDTTKILQAPCAASCVSE